LAALSPLQRRRSTLRTRHLSHAKQPLLPLLLLLLLLMRLLLLLQRTTGYRLRKRTNC
jgi:hypothetical protein